MKKFLAIGLFFLILVPQRSHAGRIYSQVGGQVSYNDFINVSYDGDARLYYQRCQGDTCHRIGDELGYKEGQFKDLRIELSQRGYTAGLLTTLLGGLGMVSGGVSGGVLVTMVLGTGAAVMYPLTGMVIGAVAGGLLVGLAIDNYETELRLDPQIYFRRIDAYSFDFARSDNEIHFKDISLDQVERELLITLKSIKPEVINEPRVVPGALP